MKYLIPMLLLGLIVSLFSCREEKRDTSNVATATMTDTAFSQNDIPVVKSKNEPNTTNNPLLQKDKKQFLQEDKNEYILNYPSISSEKAMDSLYAAMDKKPEVFVIDNSRDTTFTCAEGTIITIPANCFLDKNKKRIGSPITFEVKEYYSTSDMLFANLNSVSDSNLLETSGMLHIQASTNGSKLVLSTSKTIEVQMPASTLDDRMELFYGHNQERKLNWKKSNTRKSFTSRDKGSHNCSISVYYTKSNQEIAELSKRESNSYSKIVVPELMDTVQLSFDLDSKGNIKNYQAMLNNVFLRKPSVSVFYDKTPFLSKDGYFMNVKNHIRFNRSYQFRFGIGDKEARYHGIRTPYHSFSLDEKLLKNLKTAIKDNKGTIRVTLFEIYTNTSNLKYKNAIKKMIESDSTRQLSQNEAEYYIYNLNNLGWINSDRFINTPKDSKTDFKIAKSESGNMDTKIIFKDIKAIMQGFDSKKTIDFNSVPKSMDIVVMGIRYKDSKYEMATYETTTSNTKTTLIYSPMSSIKEIKDKILELTKGN